MRFAGANSNTSSFITAGKAAADSASKNFQVARENSPDYGMLANENMKNRSKERQVATAAEASVRRAGLQAMAKVKRAEIKVDAEGEISKLKSGLRRKAGVIGALGAVAGGAIMGVENNRAKKRQAERDAAEAAQEEERLQILRDGFNNMPEAPEAVPYEEQPFTYDVPRPTKTTLSEDWKPSEDSTSTTEKPTVTSTKPTQKPAVTSKGTGKMSPQFKKIYDLAVADGRTKFPEIVAAQAMHETGHLQNPNSVYFASGKTNPFGQTGDRGYGTMSRDGDPSGWSRFPDLQTAVSDHIDLWHSTKNHSENYNAYDTIEQGLNKVIPAYSPNSDPANAKGGFTENKYKASVKKILRDNGFNVP